MSPASRLTNLDAAWFSELPERLEQAAEAYDLTNTPDWGPMAEISAQTRFEGIEVHADSIVRQQSSLVAPATIFVELIYDPNSKDPVSFHDSYPARVFFTADKLKKEVSIKKIEIDNRSFYLRK